MEIFISTDDGEEIKGVIFQAASPKGTVIIAPAMGVGQGFYKHLAGFLSNDGFTTITFDYRGIGKSKMMRRKENCSLYIWGNRDIDGVISYCKKSFPDQQLYLVGHSIAGQIFPFAPKNNEVNRAYFIASQNVSKQYWKGIYKIGVNLFWYFILPLSNHLFSGLPGFAYGGKEKIPFQIARDWAAWGKSRYGAPGCVPNGREYYSATSTPSKFHSVAGDHMLAPAPAVVSLYESYGSKVKAYEHIEDESIGHFGFFRKRNENLWNNIITWFNSQ
jgi:predicted alpha/beta hydrolase